MPSRRLRSITLALVPLPGDETQTRTPVARARSATLAERLWVKVAGPWLSTADNPIGQDDCWPYFGAQGRNRRGFKGRWHYGRIRGEDGRMVGAHVAALLVSGKPKPAGEYLACHSCNNHICCNPRHLYWGTWAENMADQVQNGTRSFVPASVYSRSAVADWIAAEEVEHLVGAGRSA